MQSRVEDLEQEQRHPDINEGMEDLTLQEEDPIIDTLRRVFKFQDFKDGQREIIDNVMSSQDGVVLLPTGGGKTLCFTLPAIISPGLTIVVFPTLSLIQDMHERLVSVCPCAALTGECENVDKKRIIMDITNSRVKLLLTTPEQLQDQHFQACLDKTVISRLVID